MLTAAWASSAVGWRSESAEPSRHREEQVLDGCEEHWALGGVDLFEVPDPFPVGLSGAEIAAQQIGRGPSALIGAGQALLAAGPAALPATWLERSCATDI